jgi:predicted dehydrogenase
VAVVGAGNFARSMILPALAKMSDVSLAAVASARGVNARDLATK